MRNVAKYYNKIEHKNGLLQQIKQEHKKLYPYLSEPSNNKMFFTISTFGNMQFCKQNTLTFRRKHILLLVANKK